jgi:hypothetical protein
MAAGNTYEAIASTTLSATASSIDFTSISSAYTDLVMIMYLQDSGGGVTVRINNDSGSNYSRNILYGSSSTAAAYRDSGTTIPTGGQASPGFAPEIMHFMNYSNTTTYKTVLTRQNEAPGTFIAAGVSLWRSTSAINQITVNATSTNSLQIGTQVSLYGIKAA